MPRKDPKKPKGAKNAYQCFLDAVRKDNITNGIQKDFSEFSKYASAKWKQLDDDDKKTYNKQAETDKKRYLKEMEGYNPPSDSDSDEGPKKKKKKTKDPNAPKKPQSAYFQFSSVNRQATKLELAEAGKETGVTEVATRLGEKWRNMDDEDKVHYQELAAKDKLKYQVVMEKYNAEKYNAEK